MLLDLKEQKIAQRIIKQGLDDAAKSLEFFTMSETRQEFDEEFAIVDATSVGVLPYKGKVVYLLTTQLEGELNGVAYLLFSEEEVNALMDIRYSNHSFDEVKYQRKRDGLILEIDNIITASVMSQFANYFNYNTYGGTPKLDIVSYDELLKVVEEGRSNSEFALEFKAKLVSEGVNINANFVWFVDQNFINGIKKVSESASAHAEVA